MITYFAKRGGVWALITVDYGGGAGFKKAKKLITWYVNGILYNEHELEVDYSQNSDWQPKS